MRDWFQTLPHFVEASTDNPLPLVTAEEVRWQNKSGDRTIKVQQAKGLRTLHRWERTLGKKDNEMFSHTFPGNSEEGRQDTTTSFCKENGKFTLCDIFNRSRVSHQFKQFFASVPTQKASVTETSVWGSERRVSLRSSSGTCERLVTETHWILRRHFLIKGDGAAFNYLIMLNVIQI